LNPISRLNNEGSEAMKKVTAEAFIDVLLNYKSTVLQAQLERLDLERILDSYGNDCWVQDGDIRPDSLWQPTVANLIVIGSIHSSAFVNAQCSTPPTDEGGSLWILGDLTCRCFANYYGKLVYIDGALSVSELAVNSFEDSHLVVGGDLEVFYYHGADCWAEVGGHISMQHGAGYALPLGYTDACAQAVTPTHGTDIYRLVPDDRSQSTEGGMVDLIEHCSPLFPVNA
jgi:hypothetical protein